jgi:plastocyanin
MEKTKKFFNFMLMFFIFASLAFSSYFYKNVYFFNYNNSLYAVSENGVVYSRIYVNSSNIAFFEDKAYVGLENKIEIYKLSSLPVKVDEISLKGSVNKIAFSKVKGKDALFFVTIERTREAISIFLNFMFLKENLTSNQTNQTTHKIFSYSLSSLVDNMESAKEGIILYDENGISLVSFEPFNDEKGINYNMSIKRLFPSIRSRANILETPIGYFAGSITGLLIFVNKDGETVRTINLDGDVNAIALAGNELRVLTSKYYYNIQIPGLEILNKYKIKESQALLAKVKDDGIIALYPNSIVFYRDRPRQRYVLDGYPFTFSFNENNLLVGYVKNMKEIFKSFDLSNGCYIYSFEEEAGYIPFYIKGFLWPLTATAFIKANEFTYTSSPDNFGNFSLPIDPKLFDKDIAISCGTSDVKQNEMITVKKNENMPKDTFVVSPQMEKVEKGSLVTFNVTDVLGFEVSGYNLTVNDETTFVDKPQFSVMFDKEGFYDIRIEKQGFEPYYMRVEVPSFPIIIVAIIFIIILIIAVYYYMSRTG